MITYTTMAQILKTSRSKYSINLIWQYERSQEVGSQVVVSPALNYFLPSQLSMSLISFPIHTVTEGTVWSYMTLLPGHR